MNKNPVAVTTLRTCKKSFKYRIYPTKPQTKTLEDWLEFSRELYNAGLEERKGAWKQKVSISFRKQSDQLPEVKKIRPELKEVHSQVLQQVLHRLDNAFQSFFRRVKNGEKPGYPRFKSRNHFNSLVYPQEPGFHLVSKKRLYLSGIGEIKIKLHRPIEGKPKTCSIKRNPAGHWYASFSCDQVPVEEFPEAFGEVGIDPGLKVFATISDGKNEEKIENPRWFRKSEKRLTQAQRELESKKRSSKNREKAKLKVTKIHEKITRQRDDFQHKEAHKIVTKYGSIAVEDTNNGNLIKNSSREISKSFQDAAQSRFRLILSYKAENAGRRFAKTPAPWSSSTCSRCLYRLSEKLPLEERTFHCPKCEFMLDRDANAARNHLRAGQALWNSKGFQEAAGL